MPRRHCRGIAHGFFTRHGGVSQGIYASLNCGLGSRDDPAAVGENRARVAAHPRRAQPPHRAPGARRRPPSSSTSPGQAERPRADAIVTATRGMARRRADRRLRARAVRRRRRPASSLPPMPAGAGRWAGSSRRRIAAMEGLGARRERIRAAVGPCIGQAAYEVGPEFEQEFLARDPAARPFFSRPGAGDARPHFDLPGYVVHRLRARRASGQSSCRSLHLCRRGGFLQLSALAGA